MPVVAVFDPRAFIGGIAGAVFPPANAALNWSILALYCPVGTAVGAAGRDAALAGMVPNWCLRDIARVSCVDSFAWSGNVVVSRLVWADIGINFKRVGEFFARSFGVFDPVGYLPAALEFVGLWYCTFA